MQGKPLYMYSPPHGLTRLDVRLSGGGTASAHIDIKRSAWCFASRPGRRQRSLGDPTLALRSPARFETRNAERVHSKIVPEVAFSLGTKWPRYFFPSFFPSALRHPSHQFLFLGLPAESNILGHLSIDLRARPYSRFCATRRTLDRL